MFGFFKKDDIEADCEPDKHLQAFLDKVDEEYMKAFSTKSTKTIGQYCSRDCAVKLTQVILSSMSTYFGAPKFRVTTWCIDEKIGDTIVLLKEVKFDKVRIGGSMKIGVATDYAEEWHVDISTGKPVITHIKKVA